LHPSVLERLAGERYARAGKDSFGSRLGRRGPFLTVLPKRREPQGPRESARPPPPRARIPIKNGGPNFRPGRERGSRSRTGRGGQVDDAAWLARDAAAEGAISLLRGEAGVFAGASEC